MDPDPVDRRSPVGPSACDGLSDGWARRLSNHQPVHAAHVAREEGPFYCAACHAEVILRQGAERADHFAHERPRQASPGGEESALHRACKQEIHAALAAENSFCAPRLRISQDFVPLRRRSFIPDNERKAVPACHLWFDGLAPWW